MQPVKSNSSSSSNSRSAQSGQQLSVPSLSTPKGGGAIRGLGESFESQDFTGSASFSIPIPAPPARGISPELSLSYSSAGGNGIFGMGYGVSLSSIARKTSNGIPRYDGDDTFALSDESDLVPALIWNKQEKKWIPEKRVEPEENPVWEVLAYRPRSEKLFARIERWTRLDNAECYWQVLTGNNQTHWYGRSDNSRIFDPEQPGRVFQWLLDETQDALGNKIIYRYKPENDENLQPAIYETGRDHSANRYISTIDYGNYLALSVEHFAFRIAFDYGEFSLEHPDAPAGKWELRPDPFSSYRSGFEIRTLRRCKNILIYHCFHDQFGGKPFLSQALSLEYMQASALSPAGQPAPDMSFLKSVGQTGFRKQKDGSYQQQSPPPVTFNYTGFQPASQSYQQLKVEGGGVIPGNLEQGQYLSIDLKGEGIPGLLYSDGTTTLQWEPQGHGLYYGPLSPTQFPIENDLRNSQLDITSLDGNGEPDLLVRSPGRSGYYRFAGTGAWESFHPFPSVPLEITNPQAQIVDMDGDGRADVLVFDNDRIRSYPSLGLEGYGPPDVVQKRADFPVTTYVGQEEVLTFADLLGDGLSHRVRIRSGIIECWPNLGYGRFGAKILMGNAPTFDSAFNAAHLYFADVDGSGTTDLIYVKTDHLQVYFNQSGNSFSDPLTIPLPAPYDKLSRISFADINGNGTSCLILTRLSPVVTHHVYDFAGNVKPYLLAEIDNHRGATTRIKYSTSVKQYLEDRQAGRTWATRLFFPVQVVDTVESLDEISGSRHVSRHKYHDGYYDPEEREFKGFGFIETWDTENYAEFLAASKLSKVPIQPLQSKLYVPPTYTRSWYHTGAFLDAGVISRQYAEEYWPGDPQACVLPESTFDPEIYLQDAQTLRQAYVAMAGQKLRQEVYGLDDSPAATNPFTVSETNVMVRLLQPLDGQAYAVFFAYTRESLACDYERNPTDPRIQHDFTLAVDEFGNIQSSCTVAYPRRQNLGVTVYPEQAMLRAVLTKNAFINHVETQAEPYRWVGVNCESQQYELAGLTPSVYFTFKALEEQAGEALQHPLAYGQPFTSGQQARLFTWMRSYEWNENQTDALPLGGISSRGLRHHAEHAVLTTELVQATFQARLTTDELTNEAGYWLDQNYWWNRGFIQHYFKEPEKFFLPCQSDGAFAGVELESHLNPTFTLVYDAYNLLQIQITHYLKGGPSDSDKAADLEPVILMTRADNDYHSLLPCRVTDPNGNVAEVIFDPLGMVIASTIHGTEGGAPAGDDPLTDYSPVPDPTFEDVINSPQKYLQNATTFFFYDLMAWVNRQQPASAVELHRQTFVHDLKPEESSLVRVGIAYSDGFGRVIEHKSETDRGPVVMRDENGNLLRHPNGKLRSFEATRRWVVSGYTIYNNKGEPTEEYLPWFSNVPEYETQQQLIQQGLVPPPLVYHYDALDRVIRIDTPKGFFSKVEFSTWEVKSYDEDDTVKDSIYYNDFTKNPTTPAEKNEKNALDKAAAFYNTPSISILDNLGRSVRDLENNLGAVRASDFDGIVAGVSVTPQELWQQLVTASYLEPDSQDLTAAWVTDKLQPYDTAFQQAFSAEFKTLATPLLNLLKENGLPTLHELDIQGREIRSTDPRLFYSNVTQGTDYHNFSYLYDMAGKALVINSADAGLNQSLDNIFDNLYWNWSPRNFEQVISYDRMQRRVQVRVKAFKHDGTLMTDNLVETFTYGETQTQAENYNLRGQLYQQQDQSGVIVNSRYSLLGDLQETTRQFTTDYKDSINWAVDVPLEPDIYRRQFYFNAFSQLVSETTPQGSVTGNIYNQAGLLVQVAVTLKDDTSQDIIKQIQYDANSQRLAILYANGVTTTYEYEDTTLRLLRLFSGRPGASAAGQVRDNVLQDINYTYDPVGNITRTYDGTYQTVFHNNQKVEPLSEYTYDALYHLLVATGRQHPGITSTTYRNNEKDGAFKQSKYYPLPNDANALENYRENYTYDDAGNLLTTRHVATSSWTRQQEIMPDSNRFKTIGAQNGISYSYPIAYDNSGNQRQLNINSPVNLTWNCCENLVSARIIERPDEVDDSDYYTYDSNELRTRKVSERLAQGGSVIQKEEKIYLGNYEVKLVKKESEGGETTILQRQTLRVMDDRTCVAIIHYWEQDDTQREVDQAGTTSLRYQLDNHLGSVSLEVDGAAQLISYEEYFPYGGTAFIAGRNQKEVKLKDYRYSGKERDDSTGLYYYGARYYAPWLGRWMKPDPAGTVDGLNLYAFVGGNPVLYGDVDGTSKQKQKPTTPTTPTYKQSTDPTLLSLMRASDEIVGESAVNKLDKGLEPKSDEVRVKAQKRSDTTMGQGLHEIVPTSERKTIAKIKDTKMRKEVALAQSGARSTPALTVLKTATGSLAGHTGTFVDPKKPRSSQGTSGQAAAHDSLRSALTDIVTKGNTDVVAIDVLNAGLDTMATGPEILNATHLLTLTPNLTTAPTTKDLAITAHQAREDYKDRSRALKRNLSKKSQKRTRSPSPARDPMTATGGGEYSKKARTLPQVPPFPMTDTTAHMTAWATQSMRL
jgi:RHS repeat-associated protein